MRCEPTASCRLVDDKRTGELHLLVKTYFGNDRFPPGGTLGNLLDVLEVGEEVDARGPLGEVRSTYAESTVKG